MFLPIDNHVVILSRSTAHSNLHFAFCNHNSAADLFERYAINQRLAALKRRQIFDCHLGDLF
jgi:hypothetical protein